MTPDKVWLLSPSLAAHGPPSDVIRALQISTLGGLTCHCKVSNGSKVRNAIVVVRDDVNFIGSLQEFGLLLDPPYTTKFEISGDIMLAAEELQFLSQT